MTIPQTSAQIESLHSSLRAFAAWLVRTALGAGFLLAVPDRFGLWGPSGTPSVAWGSFQNFLAYTARLNPWCPGGLIPALGWFATFAETVLGPCFDSGFSNQHHRFVKRRAYAVLCPGHDLHAGRTRTPELFRLNVLGRLFLAACRCDRWSLDSLLKGRGGE